MRERLFRKLWFLFNKCQIQLCSVWWIKEENSRVSLSVSFYFVPQENITVKLARLEVMEMKLGVWNWGIPECCENCEPRVSQAWWVGEQISQCEIGHLWLLRGWWWWYIVMECLFLCVLWKMTIFSILSRRGLEMFCSVHVFVKIANWSCYTYFWIWGFKDGWPNSGQKRGNRAKIPTEEWSDHPKGSGEEQTTNKKGFNLITSFEKKNQNCHYSKDRVFLLVLEQDQKFKTSTQMLARRAEMKQKQASIQSVLRARYQKKQKTSLPQL